MQARVAVGHGGGGAGGGAKDDGVKDAGVAELAADVERGLARGVDGGGVGAVVQHVLDHLKVAELARHVQRRVPAAVLQLRRHQPFTRPPNPAIGRPRDHAG